MAYIFSTATNNTVYCEYDTATEGGIPQVIRRVQIKGGANVPNNEKTLLTPMGVATQVSEEDAAWLAENAAFKRHVAKGFMLMRKSSAEPNKVAANMTKKDRSVPKTPSDFEAGKVTTGAAA